MSFAVAEEIRMVSGKPEPFVHIDNKLRQVAFAATSPTQAAFLMCPEQISLLQGARFSGKTILMMADYLQFVGQGFGPAYKGAWFRQDYPQCFEAEQISKTWFPKIFPGANYNHTHHLWTFPKGETFRFCQMPDAAGFEDFRGHDYPWIGIDEAADWASQEAFNLLLSLNNRSTDPRIPRHVRLATNCWGRGADWIMEYFHLTRSPSKSVGDLIVDDLGPPRRYFTVYLEDNAIGMAIRPDYIKTLLSSTSHDLDMQRSYIEALWVAPSTSFFHSVDWSCVRVPDFQVPAPGKIRISLDHGFSISPTAVSFAFVSKGDFDIPGVGPSIKGDIIVCAEAYFAVKPNVGDGSDEAKIAGRLHEICRLHEWPEALLGAPDNVADTSIFSANQNSGVPDVAAKLRHYGVVLERANKERILGWSRMLRLLANAKPPPDGPRTEPALFIMERCTNLLRTLPNLPRDAHDPNDVDSDCEDHLADALRYYLMRAQTPAVRFGRIDTLYPGARHGPRLVI